MQARLLYLYSSWVSIVLSPEGISFALLFDFTLYLVLRGISGFGDFLYLLYDYTTFPLLQAFLPIKLAIFLL